MGVWADRVAFGLIVVFAFVLGAGIRIARPTPAPAETCWKDPHPERLLDFDFYIGVDGTPNRCGFTPSTSIFPQVLRGQPVECYPLTRIECRK